MGPNHLTNADEIPTELESCKMMFGHDIRIATCYIAYNMQWKMLLGDTSSVSIDKRCLVKMGLKIDLG